MIYSLWDVEVGVYISKGFDEDAMRSLVQIMIEYHGEEDAYALVLTIEGPGIEGALLTGKDLLDWVKQ